MTEFMALVGFIALSACLFVWFHNPALDGLAKRLTARRIARQDYWESYRRQMRSDEVRRVIEAVERG